METLYSVFQMMCSEGLKVLGLFCFSVKRRTIYLTYTLPYSIYELIYMQPSYSCCLFSIRSLASITGPYKLPSVRQTSTCTDSRLESIAEAVMKVVMFLESLYQNVLLDEPRSCQSATSFMTGNLISRRMEVFRVTWQQRATRGGQELQVQTQLTTLWGEMCWHREY